MECLKRAIATLLVLVLMVGILPVPMVGAAEETVTSGTYGDNGTWTYDPDTKALTYYGDGPMMDYADPSQRPDEWEAIAYEVEKVVLTGNITSIGDYAFSYFAYLTEIQIPEGVTSIGKQAFWNCSRLTTVELPEGLTEIDYGAFWSCTFLTSINIPDSVTSIGGSAFSSCERLPSIHIPRGIVSINAYAFHNCAVLTSITIPNTVTNIGESAFASCDALVSVDMPDSVTSIGEKAFFECKSLSDIVIPESVTSIGDGAFNGCTYLTSISIPGGITGIGEQTFRGCIRLESVEIADSVTSIGDWAFNGCVSLASVNIPNSVASIGSATFGGCSNLSTITLPDSVTSIGTSAFYDCGGLTSILFEGNAPEILENAFWEVTATVHYPAEDSTWTEDVMLDYGGELTWVCGLPGEEEKPTDGFLVLSNYTNLCVSTDNTITLKVGMIADGVQSEDVSGITFQVADGSVLELSHTAIVDNFRQIKLKGIKEGTTTLTLNDSASGQIANMRITVYDNKFNSYSLNIPEQAIEKYPTILYNVNGLYADSYEYTVHDDQSATVSFDVYNSNYTYGIIEVCNENGNVVDAVLIDKMTENNTSLKEIFWDSPGYLVRDIVEGNLFTYRSESGYSKKSEISVEIPQNGYIRICTDPADSALVALINSADIMMQFASLAGDIKDYEPNSKEFAQAITTEMVTSKVFAELLKDDSSLQKKLWKNISKEVYMSKESIGNFTDTICKNIEELNLGGVIADTAVGYGWNVGEDTFLYFAGPDGTVIKGLLFLGSATSTMLQFTDLLLADGTGSVYIHNQGGGFRSSNQIKVESETPFPDEYALNVFTVTPNSELFDAVKSEDPELYEAITQGLTHTYNISLLKNGAETQPEDAVTVYIPIPEEMLGLANAGKASVYRMEEDGTMTEMNVAVKDGFFVFTTEHFSLYTLVGYAAENEDTLLGDADSNGRIQTNDAKLILQYCAEMVEDDALNLNICDVDGNGRYQTNDAKLILQYCAEMIENFPAAVK